MGWHNHLPAACHVGEVWPGVKKKHWGKKRKSSTRIPQRFLVVERHGNEENGSELEIHTK
jgi:hypothetical protein